MYILAIPWSYFPSPNSKLLLSAWKKEELGKTKMAD
jgi:hypothetical protein